MRGTHFDLYSQAALVTAVDSTVEIDVVIHVTPRAFHMVVSPIQSSDGAAPARLTLAGLLPSTAYYRYTDDYEHLDVVLTDDQGQVSFDLDQSAPHLVILQPNPSTIHLFSNGAGCAFIGTFNPATVTCNMSRDVLQTIEIDSDNMTLDGHGFKVDGTSPFLGSSGLLVGAHTGVTVRNLVIDGAPVGVIASGATHSTFDNITISNGVGGFLVTLEGATTGHNTFKNSHVSVVCDPPGSGPCGYGFSGVINNEDTIQGNVITDAQLGVSTLLSVLPVISDNTLQHCDTGVYVVASLTAATISGNTVTNPGLGLVIDTAIGCEIRSNRIDGASGTAVLLGSRACEVTDNTFINSSEGLNVLGELNTVVHNRFVANIVQAEVGANLNGNLLSQAPRIGGNFWSDFDEPAEGCVDDNADGYCDLPRDVTGGSDLNPWAADQGWLDVTPPSTSVSLAGVAGLAGWYVSAVTASFTAADDPGGAGVLRSEYGFDGASFSPAGGPVGIATEGVNNLFFRSIDRAGNAETPQSAEVKIDTLPPSIAASLAPAANANGWNNSPVTVSFACTDPTSGVASCPASQDFSGEGASQQATGTATDNAGNTANVTQDVSIDLTAPTIDFSGGCGTSALLNDALSTDVTAADDLSGVGSQSVPNGPAALSTTSVGAQSLQVTAIDIAGNSAAAACDYSVIYDFLGGGGFLRPVDPPPIINVAKAGSTIPVKWRLPDGKHGFLSSLTVVTSIQAQQVSCAQFSNALADPIDATAAGASGLHFDPTEMQYIYNWKTAPMMSGKCFTLILGLNDGESYQANFRFNK